MRKKSFDILRVFLFLFAFTGIFSIQAFAAVDFTSATPIGLEIPVSGNVTTGYGYQKNL